MAHIDANGGGNQYHVLDILTYRHFITFFDDERARTKYEDEVTLGELADEIRQRSGSSKDKLPLLKLAHFGEKPSKRNCLRTDANTLGISGIEIDYDAGIMPFDAAVDAMRSANLRCIIHTSRSHVAGKKEKWRVLAPTSVLLAPTRRKELMASVNAVLGGVAACESAILSQAFYYGFVEGNGDGHRVEVLDGDFIDQRPDLLAEKVYPSRPAQVKTDRDVTPSGVTPGRDEAGIAALLKASRKVSKHGEKQWHNAMLPAVASMVGKGWSDKQIYTECAPYCDFGYGDEDIAELIRSAREKWETPDPGMVVDRMAPIVAQAIAAKGGEAPEFEPNWRERYINGRARASLHNARLAVKDAGIECSEDVFHKKMFMGRGAAAAPAERLEAFMGEINDGRLLGLRVFLSNRYGLDFTEKHVRDAVMGLAHENAFDPVCDMLAEAEASWDGVERLDRMAVDYFNCDDTELNRQCVRKTMIAAVARARRPGCKFDNILVMESPEGKYKSSAWAVLAGEGNFSDEPIIGKSGREVMEQLDGVWIHENADLAGMKKADVDAVKSFASRQVDRARPAYGHFLVEQPRRSIEVGTTNAERYLLSPTGNRRFWPVRVNHAIDLARLRAVRLQLWGEAARYQSQGESLVLEERLWAVAAVEQEERRTLHPWELLIAEMTDVPHAGPLAGVGYIGNGIVHEVAGEQRVATRVIFEHVIRVPVGQMHNGHFKTLADIMKRQGWQEKLFKLEGKPTRGYAKKVS